MSTRRPCPPLPRLVAAALAAAFVGPAAAGAPALSAEAFGGLDPSPWTLGAVLLALCALALWRWFRRLPDQVEQAGGWAAMLRDVASRNAIAAVVAWQLGAGVFRGVLARYGPGLDDGWLHVAMPIALAAATVGFLIARWLMVFAQRAWRRRRRIGS